MATTSETGIKHKTLSIQEKLGIINEVGYYFRLLLYKKKRACCRLGCFCVRCKHRAVRSWDTGRSVCVERKIVWR